MFMQNFLSVWSIKGGLYSAYTSKAIGFTALEDVAEAAALILMEGPEKHSGKDYWFSAEVLTAHEVAETLTAATGRKFTAAVRDAESFQNDVDDICNAGDSLHILQTKLHGHQQSERCSMIHRKGLA